MPQFFSNKKRETVPHALPDCSVFYLETEETADWMPDGEEQAAGYYWHFCFPGCLPDSQPFGPYETEEAAIADCRSEYGEPIDGEEN